jgi:predicted NBD/HSP70 family sugar kinase
MTRAQPKNIRVRDLATGRRSAILGLGLEAHARLGLEVRGDSLSAYLSDAGGRPRFREKVEGVFRARRAERVIDELALIAGDALEEIERQQLSLAGIMIAVPGDVDGRRGTVVSAPDLGWSQLPLLELFRARVSRLEVPVALGNARTLAALAELHRPIGAPLDSYLYVTGDGGVAARMVVDGELLVPSRPAIDEAFGHITVDLDGDRCRCGRRGCLQTRVSRAALLDRAGLGDGSVSDLIQYARERDGHALAALAECGRWLGVGLATAVNLVAAPVIVLAGDFAALAPWMVPAMEGELRRRVLGATAEWPLITASQLGAEAAAVGAAIRADGL